MPGDACDDGSQNRSGCSKSRVLGRIVASAAGYTVSSDTCSASDNMGDGACGWNSGRDHTYRIWLRTGDTIDVTFTKGSKCSGSTSWDRVFKVRRGAGCDDVTRGTEVVCGTTGSCTYTRSVTATEDAWHTLVVDGRASAFDDAGDYSLTVALTCTGGSCGC